MTKITALPTPSFTTRTAFCSSIVAVFVLSSACSPGGAHGGPAATDSATPPRVAEMASATYTGITEEPVTLVDGRWEGPPFVDGGASRPSIGLIDHFVLTGDLEGDGTAEAAVLLWESSGGSGTRLYLAAVGRRDGRIENLDTILIGDRVQIRSGEVDNGRIALDLVRAGPMDAACCPTEKVRAYWTLSEDGLSLAGQEVTGTLSIADLEGPLWVLAELGWERPVPDWSEITLRFANDRAEGKTGCNSYFAGITEGAPGEFAFNGMGTTRAACPDTAMELERSYLRILAEASTYSFQGGRLVLACDSHEGNVALVFAAREPAGGPELGADVE